MANTSNIQTPPAKGVKAATRDREMISRLWTLYVSKHKGVLFLAFAFMIVLAATQSAYVWLIRYIIDFAAKISAAGDATQSAAAFGKTIIPLVVGVTLISALAMFVQSILTQKIALKTIAGLQKDMFSALQRADFARFGKEPVGNIVSRFINDVSILTTALLRSMNNLFRDVLTIIGILISMFWMDWVLSLVILLVYPLVIGPIQKLSKTLRGNASEAQAHIGTLTSELNENFAGVRMVKTYGLEGREQSRLGKTFDERVRLYLKLVTNQAKVDPLMEIVGGLVISLVFVIGIYRVLGGHMTGGSIAAIIGAVLLLAPKARALGTLNNAVQEGLTALTRLFDIIDEAPTITNKDGAKPLNVTAGEVSLNAVAFAYNDQVQALSGVTITAKPGQTIALVGPSGGGKSTIINLIPRLYDVTAGALMIDGQDVRDVTLDSLRANIALVSQDVTLFDEAISDNIAFGKQGASEADIIAAAKSASAHDFILALPNGYQTRAGEGGSNLSGGQRQRIALARAILRDAPILLLDEATSALDAESESNVQAALDILSKDRTTIVIAHRLSTVRRADKIFVLDAGKIVESGTHESLMKTPRLYAKLRELQFKP